MLKIIDISHHQKSVDFSRAKAAGISGAIVKATESVNYVDPSLFFYEERWGI